MRPHPTQPAPHRPSNTGVWQAMWYLERRLRLRLTATPTVIPICTPTHSRMLDPGGSLPSKRLSWRRHCPQDTVPLAEGARSPQHQHPLKLATCSPLKLAPPEQRIKAAPSAPGLEVQVKHQAQACSCRLFHYTLGAAAVPSSLPPPSRQPPPCPVQRCPEALWPLTGHGTTHEVEGMHYRSTAVRCMQCPQHHPLWDTRHPFRQQTTRPRSHISSRHLVGGLPLRWRHTRSQCVHYQCQEALLARPSLQD